MTSIRLVWAGLLIVSTGLVLGPALCPGAGDAERLQELLHFGTEKEIHFFYKNRFNKNGLKINT
jgi:hypothetical protein